MFYKPEGGAIKVGSKVRELEGRHAGTVVAIFGSQGGPAPSDVVRVVWENGWRSDFAREELTVEGS